MGTIGHYGNFSFFFSPPLLSSKVEFILGLSPSFSPLSLPFSPFFSLSVSLENPGCLWCISTQTPWEGVGVVGETPLPEDSGARGDTGLPLEGTGAVLCILETQVGFPVTWTAGPL